MGESESFLCHSGLSTKAEWLQGQDVMSGKCGFEALSSYKSYWNSLNLSFLICKKKKKKKCISTWLVEWRLWRSWWRTRWQIAQKLLSKAPDKEQALCDNQSDATDANGNDDSNNDNNTNKSKQWSKMLSPRQNNTRLFLKMPFSIYFWCFRMIFVRGSRVSSQSET